MCCGACLDQAEAVDAALLEAAQRARSRAA
jgi:hypothetical protein